jgi:uncharacterized phage protein (TIGR02216 family)
LRPGRIRRRRRPPSEAARSDAAEDRRAGWDWPKLLSLWCEYRLGPPEAFWRLTPKQLQLAIKGALKALERDHHGRAWLAWHVGVLSQPLKKFPKLEDLIGPPKPVKPQSPDEIMANIDRWGIVMDAQLNPAGGRAARQRPSRPPNRPQTQPLTQERR